MTTATMGRYETNVVVEPIPGNPGYIASITGHLADPEVDPRGTGETRFLAALDLAHELHERGHQCIFLAVAAVLREEAAHLRSLPAGGLHHSGAIAGMEAAIATVEGIA